MSSFSDYLENAVLNHAFRNTALTSPATVYLAAFTASPSDAGGGTEATGGSYARVAVTFNAPVGGVIANQLVDFPEATADWGTITHFGIFDASTAGNLLAWAALTTSRSILTGDTLRAKAGDVTVTLT